MTRRQFAQNLAATAAAAMLPAGTVTAGASPQWSVHIVFDERLIGAMAVPVARYEHVVTRHPLGGDVAALWRSLLAPLWQERHTATVGYTRHAEMFVLGTLAREAGYEITRTTRSGDEFLWRLTPSPRWGGGTDSIAA